MTFLPRRYLPQGRPLSRRDAVFTVLIAGPLVVEGLAGIGPRWPSGLGMAFVTSLVGTAAATAAAFLRSRLSARTFPSR